MWLSSVLWLTRTCTRQPTPPEAAGLAPCRKKVKYADLPCTYTDQVQPLAFETLSPLSFSNTIFVTELSRRLSASTGELRETAFRLHRLSIAVQRFNSVQSKKNFPINRSLNLLSLGLNINSFVRTQLRQLLWNEVKWNKTVVRSINYENQQ